MPSHGLNQPSAYISHGLNAAGAGEASTQPSPSPTPRRKAVAPARAARVRGGGGGAFGYAVFAAAFGASYQESLFDTQLRRAATDAAELAQDPEMHAWLSGALSAEAGRGRSVETDEAVAEILLERLQTEGSAPIVRATQLAAGYVALGLHVVLVGHDSRRSLTAVYVDGKWAYADPSTSLPIGGHEPFTREKFYKIPPLPDPAPTRAELELEALRAEVARMRAELLELQKLVQQLSVDDSGWEELYHREREQREKLQAALLIGAVAVTAVVAIWWIRSSSSDATDERTLPPAS